MTATPPTTLTAALDHAAAMAVPLGFIDRRERRAETTWSDVRDRAHAVAGGLAELGVAPGDRVGIVYPTGADFFHALFGILVAGAVPVPLYPPVRLGRVDDYRRRTLSLLARVDATALLAGRRVARILGDGDGDDAGDGDAFGPPLGVHGVAELAGVGPSADRKIAHRTRPEDLALIQYTSGTTAEPKPVALSHRALVAQVAALDRLWPATDESEHRGLSWLPLYHDMGLVGCVFVAVARPGPLTLLPPELFIARPAAWLRAISATRATVSPAPGFAFGHCVEEVRDGELEGVDLSSWRFALCGAETLVPEVLERFARRFSPWGFRREALTPGYGLAEAALAVTVSRPGREPLGRRFSRAGLATEGRVVEDPAGVEIASVGKPLQGFAVEVRDKNRKPVGVGVVGRVWVRGPSLMDGYLGDPEATRKALADGWLDTGDRGFLLDGELYLTGRDRDVLILRGRNHSPEEVERVVGRLPGVTAGGAAAVSYLSSKDKSERLIVFIESEQKRDRRALGAACGREILAAIGLVADEVVVLAPGDLPRTSSGKIRRQAALERYLTAMTAMSAMPLGEERP